jgi:PST family polysaccharide transporter
MSLRQKTISGLWWSFLSQGGKQVGQFIITVILARLLSPDDFGTLAMVTVFTNFVMIFSEMGMSSALIQKQDVHDRHYYSAFWLNLVVGAGLTVTFMAVSPLIAWFYKKPELIPILSVVALNFLFSSFTIIQQTILTKEMNFKSLAVRDVVAVILAGVIGITLAYCGFGVWSLVCQFLGFTLVNAVLLWRLSAWRPRFQFAMSDIKDIFHFSANLTGFNTVNYFARNIDQLLIGKVLGAEMLGYYSLSYKIMLYPLQNISWMVSRVMFPAFSKIQNDLEKVRNVYLKMVKAISLVTFPLMAWLFAAAPEFVLVFLGDKWGPMVIVIRIFCFCGMIQSISTTMGNIILSQGRTDINLRLGLLGTAASTLAIILGIKGGIVGVALCYTLEQFIWLPYAQSVANSLIKIQFKIFAKQLTNSAVFSLFLLFLLSFLKASFKGLEYPYQLLLLIGVTAIVYSAFFNKYERPTFHEWVWGKAG